MDYVTTPEELQSLEVTNGFIAIIVLLFALFLAWAVSSAISWEGGKDRSYINRRWVCGFFWALAWIGFFFFEFFYVQGYAEEPYDTKYATFMQLATVGIAVLYPVLLYVLARLMPNSKLGSILHLKK